MKNATKQRTLGKKVIFSVGLFLSLAYVAPFLLVLLNSFKPKFDILSNPLGWPTTFTWENFQEALRKMNFFRSLVNSVIVTFFSVSILIIF